MARAKAALGAYAIAIGAFVLGAWLASPALRLAGKTAPAVVLAVWVITSAPPGAFTRRVALGLLFSAVGDLVLDLGAFAPGLIAFLVAHLFYLSAFLAEERAPKLARALPFVAFGVSLLAWVWGGLGPMRAPVAVYTLAICAMMARAAALIAPSRPWARWVLAGAITFAASDSMIALDRFHARLPMAPLLILSTYWTGQALIAIGALRRRSRT